ncbi:oligosaccharide flippase family protein [Pimelobacter simplex]|uniref:oligosaccharide flippase family protein n=1 Tax=Nocardioides simplex TaxID=2045 RepID=UPI003AAB7B5C
MSTATALVERPAPVTSVTPAVPVAPAVPAAPAAPVTQGAGWLAVGAVSAKTAQTLVLLVFAAVLDPGAMGLVALASVVLNVVTVLADLGTSTALVHLRGDAERAARTAVTLALATSAVLVAAVWITAPALAAGLRVGDDGTAVLRGVVLCAPLLAVAGVSGELLRRGLDFRRRVLPDIVGNLVGAAVTVAGLAAGLGATALVPGQLALAAVTLVGFWVVRPPVRPGWVRPDAAALLTYGRSLAAGSLLTLLVLNVDYVLVAHHLGSADVGVYSIAFRLAYMPYLLVAMVIGGAVFAHLCRLRGPAIGTATVDAAVTVHTLVVPLYAGMLVLAPHLTLLGEQWAPGVPALRWLAGYGLLLSALEPALAALKAVGRTPDLLRIVALHLVTLVGLLLLVVDRGVTAVAAAQAVSGLLTLGAAVVLVRWRVPGLDGDALRDALRRLAPVALAGLALAAAAWTADRLLPGPAVSFVRLGLAATCGLAAYAGVLLLARRSRPVRVRPSWLAVVPLGAAVLGGGHLAVSAPGTLLLALLVLVALAVAVCRVEWAAIAYVVVEPFGDLAREVHPAAVKALGAVLLLAWLVRVVAEPGRRTLREPAVVALGCLGLLLLASFVAAGGDLATGGAHALTYASYLVVVVVLVDTISRGRPDPAAAVRRLATAFALACTAAGLVALIGFLRDGGRAAGPLADANDLAFFLVAALPFVLVRTRRPLLWTPLLAGCAAILVLASLATLSRGALIGLVAMVVVALAIGAVRPVTALAVAAAAGVALVALWATHADTVDRSLVEKRHVAAQNVDQRVTTWTVAAEMVAHRPLLGQGPGGFAAESERYLPAGVPAVRQTVAHQMYLDVGAELGLPALVAFLAALGYGVRGAWRARRSPALRPLGDAVVVAFAGTLTAACFLSEQFYLPVWLLVALGTALGAAARRTGPEEVRRCASSS